jgi:hypothetical protein
MPGGGDAKAQVPESLQLALAEAARKMAGVYAAE